ncbi:protein Njmu-R1-like [Mytilus californianus]|uniref:protein Njmu-R1-like n=1 Tax=Mytilus californianus TaxID=6549 RepID=UPI00224569D8|nr:protein Njmu-R1-like [Mytilus californianus]
MEEGKGDSSNKSVIRRFYTLFDYNDSINTEDVDDVEEEESYSLTVLCTDVPASLEIELRKLLSQKLSKSAVYFGAGSVTQFDVSDEEKIETWSCYYCMLKDKEIREDGGNVKYIVCFLAPEAEMLEIFTQDLDAYCKKLSEEIRNKTDVLTTAKKILAKWHETILDFLCRCVQLLQQDVKFLLYCALIDGCLKADGGKESVCSDLKRFVKLCNMSNMFGEESTGSMDMLVDISSATIPQKSVAVTFSNDQPMFENIKCSKFCEHWSKAINSVDNNSPGEIRQAVEAFKVKYIHSINTMKRLLMEAQTDYYAYYRAYKFIMNSGNSEILLSYAHLDEIAEVKDVFTDLKNYLLHI